MAVRVHSPYARPALVLGLVVGVILLLSSLAPARGLAPRFRRIGLDDGLSQAGAQCLLQDQTGFLWAGTQDGLNRYDGYSFKVFRNEAGNAGSLPDNDVRSLCETRDGALWVGTFANGLCRFDRVTETFKTYPPNPGDPRALPGGGVRAIFEDRDGTLWIGTNGGICRYDRATDGFLRMDGKDVPRVLVSGVVQAIARDGLGRLWFGTEAGGLHRLDPATGKYVSFIVAPDNPQGLPNNSVLCLKVVRSGEIWLGTENGAARWDPRTDTFRPFPPDIKNAHAVGGKLVRAITEDVGSRIWLATDNGLSLFDAVRGDFDSFRFDPLLPESPSANDLQSLLVDRQGLLWVGAFGGGLCVYNPDVERFITHRRESARPDALCSDFVWSFAEEPSGAMWIGTDDGLARYDRAADSYKTYRHDPARPDSLSGNTILAVLADRTGTLWAGTRNDGLCRYDAKTDGFKCYRTDPKNPRALGSNAIRGLFEDRAGNLWVCTRGGGISRYDRATDTFATYRRAPGASPIPDDVRTMAEDANGTLWLGTYSAGLVRFDPVKTEFKAYRNDPKNPASISDNTIWAIHVDKTGALWVGTSNGGLNGFDPVTERFEAFRTPQGLPNDLVLGILEDTTGHLWISTNHGISRFDPTTRTFRNYDNADGLQSNEFCSGAAFKARDGEMFFGGVKGFNSFRPERVTDSSYVPPVVITGFRKFNQPAKLDRAITETREIVVGWRDNFVTFEFSSLCFTDPRKNRYAYKLEGLDSGWIPAGTQHAATYTNLDGGTYVFRVKGSNGDGVWNEEGATIRLVVVPPPWKRWWAYLLYIVAAGGGLYGAFRFETARVRARGRLREAQLRAETAEVQAQAAKAEKQAAEIATKAAEAESEAAQAKAEAAEAARQTAEIEARAAAELAARNAELDHKVRELNRKNEELIASQKRADRIFSVLAEALPGTVLDGKYRLEEKIGAGGFGAVFKATHLALGRSIAVKVFKPSPGNDSADAVERFKLEGVSASRLNHPNAITVLDFGISQEGIAFLAMELLQGRTLTRELKRRRMSQRRCAEITVAVCDALAEAHRLGIIHRDIKPDNIFLNLSSRGEVVKVVDFGIAKLTGADRTESNHQLTATGVIIGTPTYMAPERLKGEPYDGKTDVYSVGVVLYEMLAGRAPFPAKSQALTAIVAKINRNAPLLTTFNPTVPLELEAVVLRSLARRPDDRPTAKEMADLLRALMPTLSTAAGSAAGASNSASLSDTEETIDPDDSVTFDSETATTDRTAVATREDMPTEVIPVSEEPTATWGPEEMPTSSTRLEKLITSDDPEPYEGDNDPTIQGKPPDFVA